jgi:hypothetical protein
MRSDCASGFRQNHIAEPATSRGGMMVAANYDNDKLVSATVCFRQAIVEHAAFEKFERGLCRIVRIFNRLQGAVTFSISA